MPNEALATPAPTNPQVRSQETSQNRPKQGVLGVASFVPLDGGFAARSSVNSYEQATMSQVWGWGLNSEPFPMKAAKPLVARIQKEE